MKENNKDFAEEEHDSEIEAWEESLGNELSILKVEPKTPRSPFIKKSASSTMKATERDAKQGTVSP